MTSDSPAGSTTAPNLQTESANKKGTEYSLRVALPRLDAMQRILYARADDAPALRGSSLEYGDKKPLGDLSKPWSLAVAEKNASVVCKAPSGENIDSSTPATVKAEADAIDFWNSRCSRLLQPPWKSLAARNSEDEASIREPQQMGPNSSSAWPSPENRVKALAVVANFLGDTNESRYLICPQSACAWDMHRLAAAINDALKSEQGGAGLSSWSASATGLQQPGVQASVEVEARSPALAIRSLPGRLFQGILSVKTFLTASLVMGLLCWSVCFEVAFLIGHNLLGWIALLVAIVSLIFLIVVSTTYDSNGHIHEALGTAWVLQRWMPTRSCPSTASHDEVLASVPGATQAQRASDGQWWVRHGCSEIQWWEQNATAILNALRRAEQGTLFLDDDDDDAVVYGPHNPPMDYDTVLAGTSSTAAAGTSDDVALALQERQEHRYGFSAPPTYADVNTHMPADAPKGS